MDKRKVSFKAIQTVKQPTVVKFKTKSGESVSFKATKTVKKEVPVTFYTKQKGGKK